MVLDDLGGPTIITGILIRERQRGQSQGRSWNNGLLQMEEGRRAEECGHLWKLENSRDFPGASRRNLPCPHLDISPITLPPELWDSKCVRL